MRALDICDFTVIKTVNIYPSYLLHANQWASQVVLVVENLPANAGDIRDSGLIPGLGRSPGGGPGNPFQYSSLENSHGQSSLAGYSPWGLKESDTTERLSRVLLNSVFL